MRLGQHSPSRQQYTPHKQGSNGPLARVQVRILLLGAGLLVLLVFYVLTSPAGAGKGVKRKGPTPHRSLQTNIASGPAKKTQSSRGLWRRWYSRSPSSALYGRPSTLQEYTAWGRS